MFFGYLRSMASSFIWVYIVVGKFDACAKNTGPCNVLNRHHPVVLFISVMFYWHVKDWILRSHFSPWNYIPWIYLCFSGAWLHQIFLCWLCYGAHCCCTAPGIPSSTEQWVMLLSQPTLPCTLYYLDSKILKYFLPKSEGQLHKFPKCFLDMGLLAMDHDGSVRIAESIVMAWDLPYLMGTSQLYPHLYLYWSVKVPL